MNKSNIHIAGIFIAIIACTSCATASKSDIDLKSGTSTLSNLIEGVFSTSKLEVEDLAGQWTSDGSAVQFKSENFLKKAGGVAAAAAVETKLNPYYEKLGLNGAVFTIQTDGSFTMELKRMSLKGNITKLENGNFNFSFKVLGMNIGNIETYVSKSTNGMDIMFDADKLIKIVDMISSVSGSKTAKTITNILKGYDGICVGFRVTKTGTVEGEKQNNGLSNALQGLFGNGSENKTDTETKSGETTNKKDNTDTNNTKTGKTPSLLDLLKKR
ncbi:MAG: DUF4923 family protein [Prevotella sp.]|nr:DUF4923 family protein [Bacteroides sp.]MCM1366715.1 DUF4923 family protein [Prevotella sp.]MCM1437271.1 DUF4923 family protein [Prevotella sp.]